MSQATTQAAAPLTADAVRVVLFGMPDAGKSSLLGALAQAAQTQEHVLNGKLIDRTQGLVELQRRLYEERPRETLEEVTPFPVLLEPFAARGSPAPTPVDALLIDCDGRVANDLLGQRSLDGPKGNGALGRAVLQADTLVLAVDASSDPSVLSRDFGQFARFLRALEHSRGQRSEIGGLPVYLVLTKCDLLAQKDDSSVAWIDRIEERKRKVDRGFQEFLAKQAEREHMPFGKVDLHLWATAVKRPALTDSPAKPREPYGVAELFRQALESGVGFKRTRQKAERRLAWTVALIGMMLAVMVLLAVGLFMSQQSPETSALADEVGRFRSQNDTSSHLLGKNLEDNLKKLQKVRASPDFAKLPKESQDYVTKTLMEMADYQAYAARVHEIGNQFNRDPSKLQNEELLAEVKGQLGKAAPPPEYASAWARTTAAQNAAHWTKEFNALDEAVKKTRAGYERLLVDGRDVVKLWTEKSPLVFKKASEVLDEWKKLPDRDRDKDRLKDRVVPGADELTYAQVFAFPSVREAYEAWSRSEAKKRVEGLAP